ncbi:MAG: SAM-dependent methyltransferase, partial [Clostridiales bacterium]|nr:SAM-dependent methyltransferase [Clostridiales bacterium]
MPDLRIKAVLNHVNCHTLADIGCDHGKLSASALIMNKAEKVIATDISKPSLDKAKRLFEHLNLKGDFRLGDGLRVLNSGEADTVVIAGLGGKIIAEILDDAFNEGKTFSKYVLCVNSQSEKVRETLNRHRKNIESDGYIFCARKRYTLICASDEEADKELDAFQIRFGKFYKRDKTAAAVIQKELERFEKLNPKAEPVLKEIKFL